MSQVPSNTGISYTIDVKGNLAEALGRLSTEIANVSARLDGALTVLQNFKGKATQANNAVAASTQKLAQATKDSAAASERAAKATERGTAAVQASAGAMKQWVAWKRREALAREVARIEDEKAYAVSNKQKTAQQQSILANKQINKVLEERTKLLRLLDRLQARKVTLSEQETVKVGLASKLKPVGSSEKSQIAAGLASPSGLATDIKANTQAQAAYSRAVAQTSPEVQRLGDATRLLRIQEADRQKRLLELPRAQMAAADAQRRLNSEELKSLEVQRRIAQASFDRQVRDRTNNALGISKTGGGGGGQPPNFLNKVLGIGNDDDRKIGTVLRSVQRLIAAVLVLKAIRFAFAGFDSIVKDSIKFNAELETAQLGIATIITGAGQIRDITGQQVKGAQAFALAQAEAAKQTRQLRIDSLQTVAPLNRIIETFQTAIGPGLGAGLDIDQIRKFSVQISQAATAIGLEQNQLAEEIRSILTATINTRQTRIATVLGITNDDIRRAKEAGNLADLLSQKFAAFDLAGQQIGQTFDGAINRLKSSLLSLGSEASLGVFEELKQLFLDVSNLLITIDRQAGTIQINPDFKAAAEAFFQSIQEIVKSSRTLITNVNFSTVTASARLLGQAIKAVFDITVGLVSGVAKSLETIRDIFVALVAAVKAIPILGNVFNGASLQSAISSLTQMFVLFKLIRGIAIVMPAIIGTINVAMKLWAVSTFLVRQGFTGLQLIIVGVQLAMKALNVAFTRSIAGIALAVGSLIALFVLQKTGLLQTITDKLVGSEKDLQAKTDRIKELREETFRFYNELPAVIAGTSESLKNQDSIIVQMRKDFEKLNIERNNAFLNLNAGKSNEATPIGSLSGFAQEASRIALDAILSAQEKTRAIELDRRRNAESLQGALQRESSARLELLQIARDTNTTEEKMLAFQERLAANVKRLQQARQRTGAVDLPTLNAEDNKFVDQSRKESLFSLKGVVKEVELQQTLVDLSEQEAKAKRASAAADREKVLNAKQLFAAEKDRELLLKDLDFINRPGTPQGSPEIVKLNKQISDLDGEILSRRQSQLDLIAQAGEAMRKVVGIQEEGADILRAAQVDEAKIGKIQDELLQLANRRLDVQEKLAAISRTQAGEQKKITAETRALLVEQARSLAVEINKDNSNSLEQLLPGVGNIEARQKVQKLSERILQIVAETKGIEEEANMLLEARLGIQREIDQAANARLAIAAQEFAFNQRRQNLTDQSKAESEAATFAARRKDEEVKTLVAIQNQTRELRVQQDLARQSREASLAVAERTVLGLQGQVSSFDKEIAAQRPGTASEPNPVRDDLILKRQTAQDALNQAIALEGELIASNTTALNAELLAAQSLAVQQEEARIRAGGDGVTFGQQLSQAADDLAQTLPSKFQQIFATLSNIVQGFSSFASDAIVDAFDPTKKVDLKERFGRFLQDVARQIINQLVTIAVTKAALGLTGILSSGFATGGPVKAPQGFRHGGGVGRRTPTRHARGYAEGGNVATGLSVPHLRPPGIDRRDSVPAWLSVGEFVQPVKAVMSYGQDLFEAFRRGMIDPAQARALMPGSRARSRSRAVATNAVRSYATGGGVAPARMPAVSRQASQPQTTTEIVPAIVANDETVEQLFRGGKTTATRILNEWGFVQR